MESLRSVWKIKELRNKILFTVAVLFVFRLGCSLPVPFISPNALEMLFGTGTLMFLNMVSGSALARCTLFALGVSPFINASIVIQLMTVVIPSWEQMQKEDDGKKKLERYTRYCALFFACIMAVGYVALLKGYGAFQYTSGAAFWFAAVVAVFCFAGGSMATVWLGERIDEYGIGNGVSMLILAGIISRWSNLTNVVLTITTNVQAGKWWYILFGLLAVIFLIAAVVYVVYISNAEQKVPIQYAGKSGRRGGASYVPLKLIMSGVMPVIFASSILSLPATIAAFVNETAHPKLYAALSLFSHTSVLYIALLVALIFFFNFFYISIQFNSVEMANRLRKNGGVIPGFRPGTPTVEYLDRAIKKLALSGAASLAIVAAFPSLLSMAVNLPMQFGGTSLLIIVGVATETVRSIDSYRTVRHHRGFLSA